MRRCERRPPSPKSAEGSSSSSEFEFSISTSPRKASSAEELFYKGQLLPLHHSPRLSLVRSLISSSDSSSSPRDSTASSSSAFSRPSSATFDDDLLVPNLFTTKSSTAIQVHQYLLPLRVQANRLRIPGHGPSSTGVFPDEEKLLDINHHKKSTTFSVARFKRISSTAREVIRKYLKKVKPFSFSFSFSDKFSQKQLSPAIGTYSNCSSTRRGLSVSFSGSLRSPRGRRRCVYAASCPSSPSHSAAISIAGESVSSMDELQSAIQGAIAHCKNSMSTSLDNI